MSSLKTFRNIGLGSWALYMDDFEFGSTPLDPYKFGGRQAIIDSANQTIQIPASQFDLLKYQLFSDYKLTIVNKPGSHDN